MDVVFDPLHRFVPVDHHCSMPLPGTSLLLESNDVDLMSHMAASVSASSQMMEIHRVRHIRVVREAALHDAERGLALVHTDHVVALSRGTGTLLLFDTASGELLSFLATNVSADEFMLRLLPAVLAATVESDPVEVTNR